MNAPLFMRPMPKPCEETETVREEVSRLRRQHALNLQILEKYQLGLRHLIDVEHPHIGKRSSAQFTFDAVKECLLALDAENAKLAAQVRAGCLSPLTGALEREEDLKETPDGNNDRTEIPQLP